MKSPELWNPSATPPATRVGDGTVDLSNCDRELVQFPGAIMPHGVLLVLAPGDYRIVGASANVASCFGSDAEGLAGGQLDRIVTADVRQIIESGLARIAESRPPRYLGCFPTRPTVDRFDVFAHRSGDCLLLEFEAIPTAEAERWPTEPLAEVTESIAAIQAAATWQDGMSIAVRELKRLIGFDSVIGVRFLADGSGHAVAEAREPNVPSYLDKRFPRSDIPEPGRRQMVLMPVQYAPELDYEPVPLLLFDPGQDPLRIDLGSSVLRSMSRMCSRYYLNMGARSRVLLSLVHHGELWGFFSCLNATPRPVVYSDRLAYAAFAQMASLLFVEKEQADQHRDALEVKRAIGDFAAEMFSVSAAPAAWHQLPARILDPLDLAGAALCLGNRITRAGETPDDGTITAMLPWLDRQGEFFVTDRLPTLFEPVVVHGDRATGLLAARLMEPGQYLLGFRPEWVYEVHWAGDPHKPVAIDGISGEQRLTPRGSFDVWKEAVRGTARPWRTHEIEAMIDLQRTVIRLQQTQQRQELTALLERSNADLEAFSFVVSHDLQEPLRGIRNFSQFLRDRTGERLQPQERHWLDRIMHLSERMTNQIEALLQYSRAGQEGIEVRSVDLDLLLRSVLDDLAGRIAETATVVTVPRPLPSLPCDPIRTAAVFENLITNAIKYNDRAEKRVEIGCVAGATPVIFVRDNGIGILEQHQEAIFTIFRRLHGRDDYGGGTGAGLTIARKHIERQGGRLWLESTPGLGSTFYFTLCCGPDGSADP